MSSPALASASTSIAYACNHLDRPRATLPPSYPSSSSSYHPLDELYFCEECDAVRCDTCVAVEVASYFCPNCLFDVPSANVRADKNRCARSCFSCPQCDSSLSVQASDTSNQATSSSTSNSSSSTSTTPAPSYVLVCTGCKWSSRQVGWSFEKPTGIALQLQKMQLQTETAQSEFDALKDHLESYIASNAPAPSPARSIRTPSRHISHLTQMAARTLSRDVGGVAASSARARARGTNPGLTKDGQRERAGWDEIEEYEAKGSWKEEGVLNGMKDVAVMNGLIESGPGGVATLEKRWNKSWESDRMSSAILPQRIPLQTKLTKRCPHPGCRHLLIQPDTKSVRMKINMVALNYLPLVELGRRRRRRFPSGDIAEGDDDASSASATTTATGEEAERKRRERRKTRGHHTLGGDRDEDENMDRLLKVGEIYTFQLALTNPLFDPIQIRLTQPHQPRNAPSASCTVFIPTPHFTINALKDAWAYDEDDEDDDMVSGLGSGSGSGHGQNSEAGFSEEGGTTVTTTTTGTGTGSGTNTSTNTGTLGRKSRLSILAGGSSSSGHKKARESGVEKKGNISKVGIELEVSPLLKRGDKVEFDLEIRYTYRADDAGTPTRSASGAEGGEGKSKEEYKTFTFWVRVLVGEVG